MLNFSTKKLLLLLFSLGLFFQASAQVKISPIRPHTKKIAPPSSNLRTMETSLRLPFFDDFTKSDTLIDSLWEGTGGTYLNNSLALNPPSFNVVTFDGLDETGRPYNNFEDALATGEADILTSKTIDLSAYDSTSGVFLSFMWQSEGLGEEPDHAQTDEDFVTLYFYGKDSIWSSVWTKEGGTVQNFRNAIVQVKDTSHFWPGFKFRLISKGNLSGGFDVWNLDYFYLNSGRTEIDTFRGDMTLSKYGGTFLKRYSSMPYYQYLLNPKEESVDSLSILCFNLDPFNQTLIPSVSVSKDSAPTYTGIFDDPLIRSYELDSMSTAFPYKTIIGSDSINSDINSSRVFDLKYNINSPLADTLKFNDASSISFEMADYFAYDDGSAEAAFNLTGIASRLAYRFYLNEPAIITKIRIHYPQQIKEIGGTSIKLLIWDNDLNTPDKIISQVAQYTDTINEFLEYELANDEQLLLSDTFYIGYEQTTIDALPIGFDRNTNSNQEIFYQLAGDLNWNNFSDEKGSLMIRPVFGVRNDTTANEKPVAQKSYKLYPNPSSGVITIEGNVDKVLVYDQVGRVVLGKSFIKGEPKEVNLGQTGNGIYILHLSRGKMKFVEKVILQK